MNLFGHYFACSRWFSFFSFLEDGIHWSNFAHVHMLILGASRVIKNPPANAGDTGFILGSGRSPGVQNGSSLQFFFAWKIPWTEAPGMIQPMGPQSLTRLNNWAQQHADFSLTSLLCLCWGSRQCGLALFIFSLFLNFYCGIVHLKCCASSRCQ